MSTGGGTADLGCAGAMGGMPAVNSGLMRPPIGRISCHRVGATRSARLDASVCNHPPVQTGEYPRAPVGIPEWILKAAVKLSSMRAVPSGPAPRRNTADPRGDGTPHWAAINAGLDHPTPPATQAEQSPRSPAVSFSAVATGFATGALGSIRGSGADGKASRPKARA